MFSKPPTKGRILLGIFVTFVVGAILILCWYFLPKNVFILVLIGGAILFSILEYFTIGYKKGKKDEEQE